MGPSNSISTLGLEGLWALPQCPENPGHKLAVLIGH